VHPDPVGGTVTTVPAPQPEKDPAKAPEPPAVPVALPEKAAVADGLTVAKAPPIPTGFPDAPATVPVQSGGITVTETGTAVWPQPMKPARPGHVNLATVPPMTHLHVPPLDDDGGEPVTIDVYGTEVDDATAGRAHDAARAAGLTLREL